MSFKIGDWVVRKARSQNDGFWPFGATPVRVSWVDDDCTALRVDGACRGWAACLFDIYGDFHTDADLAMAVRLAYLVERDSWNKPEADWLREQVMQELLNRGAR